MAVPLRTKLKGTGTNFNQPKQWSQKPSDQTRELEPTHPIRVGYLARNQSATNATQQRAIRGSQRSVFEGRQAGEGQTLS